MLLDPQDSKPFYVGKGNNNRVFEHMSRALIDTDILTLKYDKIREIVEEKKLIVPHIIVRHGLTDREAFQIEASLIDILTHCGLGLTNQQVGHNSIEKGLMTTEAIIQKYSAKPLENIADDCVLININNSYNKAFFNYTTNINNDISKSLIKKILIKLNGNEMTCARRRSPNARLNPPAK